MLALLPMPFDELKSALVQADADAIVKELFP